MDTTTEDQPKEEVEKITKENLYTGFKVLIKYLSQYKKTIVMLSVIGVLSAIGNGIVPYIAGRFFDAILTPSSFNIFGYILPLYVALLILWAVVQFITYILDWRINITSEYLSNTIWLDYLSKGFGYLLNLPISFHKKNKMGEITNKINQAAGSLETIAGRIVIDLAPQILSILIALGVAFYLKPVLASLLVLSVVIYVFVLLHKVKPLSAVQKAYYDKFGYIWGESYDVITNTLAIKQATAEKYEQDKMDRTMKSAVPLWMQLTKIWGALSLYQRLSILVTQILIFAISVIYIHQGNMTLGELLAFNAYAAMIFGPFVTITRQWQTIQNGIVNIQETEKILQTEPENYSPDGSKAFALKGNIDFTDVSFGYEEGKPPVLQDISFSIKAGEVIALVGESGVGKSTLIDLVSGYNFASKGEVMIDGIPMQKIDLRSLRSQIAVVPQEVVLFNDTIKTNIKYGNFNTTDTEIETASRKAHALDFINKFSEKWEQVVGERGVKLSVGQKQRVAIARAILRNPKILILDEPTSALDAGSEKIITQSLEELMAGKTTFIIAHRLSTVRRADKILVFKDGKIIESGKHDELLEIPNGEYRRLYELQIGLHN